MKVNKEIVAFWVIGAIMLLMGTAVKHYLFEIIAVIIISIGALLSVFWTDLFKETQQTKQTGEKTNDT